MVNMDPIKVLMIGTDRNLFVPESAIRERIKIYASFVQELHIIVFAVKSLGLKPEQIEPNVWLYPTNSLSRWFYPLDASRMGKKIVFDKKFVRGKSLITTQDPFECGWAGMKVKNKWRIPLEVQLHTDPFSLYFGGFLNFIRKRLIKKTILKSDSVRVVSRAVKDALVRNFSYDEARISVLPIYVDKEEIEEGKVVFDLHARFGWHFILLSVSRLAPEKNLPMALEVLKKVHNFFPTTGLVIVGAGSEEGALKSLTKKLKLENNVAFVGWQENLASYYKSANMFIQTSNFEGYGLSLVEAGLSGLPIVTTAVGIANDLENGKEAYVCPVGDAEYMFKAVYDLIENNQKRQSLAINMKNFLKTNLSSKEEYLTQLKNNWEKTASRVS